MWVETKELLQELGPITTDLPAGKTHTSLEIHDVLKTFRSWLFDSVEDARKKMHEEECNEGQPCNFEYSRSKVDHSVILHSPGHRPVWHIVKLNYVFTLEFEYAPSCSRQGSMQRQAALTQLLWKPWGSWWSWGFAGPWQSSAPVPRHSPGSLTDQSPPLHPATYRDNPADLGGGAVIRAGKGRKFPGSCL